MGLNKNLRAFVFHLFFLQHLLCWSGHHCESPQPDCTFCQEWAPGNAILSGLSCAMFLSGSHLGCKDSAHRSQHLLLLDPRWTTDCLSCFGWMPWDQQQGLVLKKKEDKYYLMYNILRVRRRNKVKKTLHLSCNIRHVNKPDSHHTQPGSIGKYISIVYFLILNGQCPQKRLKCF